MQKVVPFLWFNGQASSWHEAARLTPAEVRSPPPCLSWTRFYTAFRGWGTCGWIREYINETRYEPQTVYS
jgi:hypothetical protein